MNTYSQSIRVIYPQESGRIALRTDENWDVDVGPVSSRGCTTRFQIETDRPYFYFKPVLIRDGVSFCFGWQWPKVFGKIACLSSTFVYLDSGLAERQLRSEAEVCAIG